MKLLITVSAAAILLLGACDSGGGAPDATPAAAPAAAPAPDPEPAAPAAPSASEAAAARAAVFADEAAFSAACVAEGALDATVCDCVSKKTVETIGAGGLFRWVWEGYVNRDGMAQMRSRKWFTDNGFDTAGQQKFADAVGTCYTLQ